MEQQVAKEKAEYPITVGVVYPEKLYRLSTFFRFFLLIPQMIVLWFVSMLAGIFLFFSWFAIMFTGKYPKGLFNYVAGYLRWSTRVTGYSLLLTDKYPPFSMNGSKMQQQAATEKVDYPITVGIAYPERLSRLSTFFRVLLLIPQNIVLCFLEIAVFCLVFFVWWIILFTGTYPVGFFDFVAGYLRWNTRVFGYTLLLTDKYPPFSKADGQAVLYVESEGVVGGQSQIQKRDRRLTKAQEVTLGIVIGIVELVTGLAAGLWLVIIIGIATLAYTLFRAVTRQSEK